MSEREKMSPVDTAWLRMDRPSNLMLIVGILALSPRVDFARLRQTIEYRLAMRYRRFRQRVHQDVLGAWWEDDPEFDIDNHVVRRALPAPGDKAELQRLASELAAEPLGLSRPLWRFDFIENYDGGSAVVVRIHHCIADGIALVGVMLSMTDLTADAPPPELPPQTIGHGHDDNPWLALMDPMTRASMAMFGMTKRFWTGYFKLLARPDEMIRLGKDGVGFAEELVKLLAMPADSPTRFKGHTGTRKHVAWCDPIPLADVKALSKALGCSVNDVMLTAVAGALRSYLVERGDDVATVEVRALVPVNLRSADDEGKLGNRFGMVTLLLPVYEANPFARLFKLRERMLEMKGSYQPPLTLVLLAVSGLAPRLVQEKFLDMLANKASAVMTNVPGPQQPLYLAGSRIGQIMFWVPQSGDVGMGVSILSYNDTVQFGLITDHHFVPDPETLTPLFVSEFEKMLTALMFHDWGEPLDPVALEQTIEAEMSLLPRAPRSAARRTGTPRPKQGQRVPRRFRNL